MPYRAGLWNSLEVLRSPAAVMAEWRYLLGDDFDAASTYLAPTDRQAASYPCTNMPACDCRHNVVVHSPHHIVATCQCEVGGCPPICLKSADLIVFKMDLRRLGDAIRFAFGFEPATSPLNYRAPCSCRIGTYGPLHSPVIFLSPDDEPHFLREIEGLFEAHSQPFLLVTPTRGLYTPAIESAIHRQGCALLPCSVSLAIEADGSLRQTASIEPLLTDFIKRHTAPDTMSKTIESFGRNLEAVATEKRDLRRQNAELQALLDNGFLKFVTRVDATDFQALAAILLTGNRHSAAQALNIPTRTFYDKIAEWPSRGPEYRRMYRLVEWRKKHGRKITVRLEGSLLDAGKSDEPENPQTIAAILDTMRDKSASGGKDALLKDIFEAIANQNPENWQDIQKEVLSILREEIPQ